MKDSEEEEKREEDKKDVKTPECEKVLIPNNNYYIRGIPWFMY